MTPRERIEILEHSGGLDPGLESPLADLPREPVDVVGLVALVAPRPELDARIVKCRPVDDANPEALVDKRIVFDPARFLAGVRVDLDQRELVELEARADRSASQIATLRDALDIKSALLEWTIEQLAAASGRSVAAIREQLDVLARLRSSQPLLDDPDDDPDACPGCGLAVDSHECPGLGGDLIVRVDLLVEPR